MRVVSVRRRGVLIGSLHEQPDGLWFWCLAPGYRPNAEPDCGFRRTAAAAERALRGAR